MNDRTEVMWFDCDACDQEVYCFHDHLHRRRRYDGLRVRLCMPCLREWDDAMGKALTAVVPVHFYMVSKRINFMT